MPTVPPRFHVAAGILVERGNAVHLVETPRRGWEFQGGRIEESETIIVGVLRELREEANVVAHDISQLGFRTLKE